MRSRPRTFLIVLGAVMLFGASLSAASAVTVSNNVKMEPPTTAEGSWADARGQIQVYMWDINGDVEPSSNQIVLDAQLAAPILRNCGGSCFYTLWMTTPTLGTVLVHTFNTSGHGSNGVYTESFVAAYGDPNFLGNIEQVVADENVLLEVYAESDDAKPAQQSGTLVLSGLLER